ncbi:TlpA disulfide reductase family protein [Kiritimatiellota bacterium B12222]|nr:TlpA disulfide reductase family protein [Kiritimatiellota bacterium B12222]
MKKTLLTLLASASLFATTLPLFADSVDEISKKHYQAMLEDLTIYINANPQATDIDNGRKKAIEAAFYAEDNEALLSLLEAQFNDLQSQTPLPANELAQSGMMLVQFSLQQGNKEQAQEVLATFEELAKTDGNPVYAQVTGMITAQLNKPSIGDTLELTGTTLEGKKLSLSDYKGKVVMVDFWATWCGPCIAEMPNVKAAYAKYHDQGFEIIGISLDRSIDPLENYIADNELAWPMLWDNDQKESIADKFAITSIPSIFILDKTGKVVAVDTRGPQLEQTIEKLLAE